MQAQKFHIVEVATGKKIDTLTSYPKAIESLGSIEDHEVHTGAYAPDKYDIELEGPRKTIHAKDPEMARRIKDQFFKHPGLIIEVGKQSTEIGQCPAWHVHDKWNNWIATIIIDEFLYSVNA